MLLVKFQATWSISVFALIEWGILYFIYTKTKVQRSKQSFKPNKTWGSNNNPEDQIIKPAATLMDKNNHKYTYTPIRVS